MVPLTIRTTHILYVFDDVKDKKKRSLTIEGLKPAGYIRYLVILDHAL
jgi:hypothetical protein